MQDKHEQKRSNYYLRKKRNGSDSLYVFNFSILENYSLDMSVHFPITIFRFGKIVRI
jgi:hypothetical protein